MGPRSLYARARQTVLVHPSLGFAIVLGALMHAAGHAMLAAAGGVLARSLAGGAGPMDDRSMRALRDLGAGDPMLGVAALGLIAAIAKLVGGVVAGWGEARVAGEVGTALRLEVLDRVLGTTSLRAPRQRDHGRRVSGTAGARSTPGEAHVGGGAKIADVAALTTHVSDVEKGVSHGVFAEMRALLQLAPLVVLLAILAPRLAGSAALALGAFAVLVMVARRALKRNHARAARENEALLGAADEAVRHADLWATYGAERRIRAHVEALGQRIVRTASRLRARTALLSGTSEVLGALALVLTLALVSTGAIAGVERGAIVPFAIAFFMAYKPLRELVEARLSRGRGEEALAELRLPSPSSAISLQSPVSSQTRRDERREETSGGSRSDRSLEPGDWGLASLTVEGLVAQHGLHAPISLRVAPGTITAIVGPTGIGKTSLLRALLGLDSPRAGTISWGDRDLTSNGVGPGERPFAWVPQDAPILGDTLVANILLGVDGVNDVDDVLTDLGATELAQSVGDSVLASDRSISGGERQWIAVARALATRLPVLLLDEPTSSLDPAAQEKMLRAIAGLRGKRSVILVTHRTEPLAIADHVVRLGAALELPAGSHREDAEHGAGRHEEAFGAVELTIEDVGAVALEEAQLETSRERIDVVRAE